MELHSRPVTQSILSASDQVSLNAMIAHFDLGKVFRFVFGIEDRFAGSKIDRGHQLMRDSNITAEKTVLIGDTLHDLEVAQALGVEVVLVSHGHQCAKRLRLHSEKVIPS